MALVLCQHSPLGRPSAAGNARLEGCYLILVTCCRSHFYGESIRNGNGDVHQYQIATRLQSLPISSKSTPWQSRWSRRGHQACEMYLHPSCCMPLRPATGSDFPFAGHPLKTTLFFNLSLHNCFLGPWWLQVLISQFLATLLKQHFLKYFAFTQLLLSPPVAPGPDFQFSGHPLKTTVF